MVPSLEMFWILSQHFQTYFDLLTLDAERNSNTEGKGKKLQNIILIYLNILCIVQHCFYSKRISNLQNCASKFGISRTHDGVVINGFVLGFDGQEYLSSLVLMWYILLCLFVNSRTFSRLGSIIFFILKKEISFKIKIWRHKEILVF